MAVFTRAEEKDMTFKLSGVKDAKKCPQVMDIEALHALDSKIIKYLVYCYDANSPLVKRSRGLAERKAKAGEAAGLSEEEFLFVSGLGSIALVEAIVAMLKYQMSNEWSLIVINEEAFEEIKKRVLVPVVDDKDKDEISALEKKDKLLQIADSMLQRIRQYKAVFYLGDKELEEAAEEIRFSPESIAKYVP